MTDRPKRGELRIYLGAAPGVGKTYAMLGEAHRRLERGTDLVAAVVETHGRSKTAELLEGIEIIPPRLVEYRGATFGELDVDAVLARRPQVVLVDELAHTNTPGSANPKRWQDIEQLLAAGITVITTVNVQHLESLNDVVTQITSIEQQEKVPDEVVRAADQIELASGSGLAAASAVSRVVCSVTWVSTPISVMGRRVLGPSATTRNITRSPSVPVARISTFMPRAAKKSSSVRSTTMASGPQSRTASICRSSTAAVVMSRSPTQFMITVESNQVVLTVIEPGSVMMPHRPIFGRAR